MKKVLIFLYILLGIHPIIAQDFTEIMGIVSRRAPWLASSLVLQRGDTGRTNDSFALESRNGKVYITATTPNAAAKGVGWYLRYYCHRSMSHMGDNLSAPAVLPTIEKKIVISSPFRYRYALNYCTVSYSMAHYTWADWERELDWMALSGVNLMLDPVGMEAVWQNTLLALGYTEEETLKYIAHPAFTAWWLMGNLEGWGGPVSQEVIEQQKELQQKILKRMKGLGIEPVIQGFYGIIPTTLKDKMNVKVVPQGEWAGGFERPDFLDPMDPAFDRIATVYYAQMKLLYGSDIKYFGGDPFHEGGSSGDLDIPLSAAHIQQEMMNAYQNSTWVLQGWHNNPSKAMLDRLDKEHTLVIELFGENTDNWKQRHGYEGTPFVWCNVSNFGEKTGLYGKLKRFADEVYDAAHSEYAHLMSGVGIIPEGINNNPVTYDWTLELGWSKEHMDINRWIDDYILYRYGKSDPMMKKAWEILLQTVYSSPTERQEGPSESPFCARPSIDMPSVSSWGTCTRHYDMKLFEQGVRLFVAAEEQYKDSETYQIDQTDLLRQLISNRGMLLYEEMMTQLKEKNMDEFKRLSDDFLALIQVQDKLLSKCKHFRLDYWLDKYAAFAPYKADRAQAIRNAKMQYTIWGPDTNPDTNLHEYAHKEWSGLLSSLYYERWKLFIEYQEALLDGREASAPRFFEVEKKWINDPAIPSTPAISDKEYTEIIRQLLR